MYANVFESWRILGESSCMAGQEYYAREIALQNLANKCREALMEYFEVYDRDQREAFGEYR